MNNKDISIIKKHLDKALVFVHGLDNRIDSALEDAKKEINSSKKNNKIPEYEEFKEYVFSKSTEVCQEKLRLKYESWIENEWKDGNNKKILNWRSKILNTIPYIKNDNIKKKFAYPVPYDAFYARKLTPQENLKYEQHLIGLGYKKSHGQGGTSFTKQ